MAVGKREKRIMNVHEKLIYTAGIVDGEGCIYIGENYRLRLLVNNTNPFLIQFLYDTYGGTLNMKPRKGNRRTLYAWALNGSQACILLMKLENYLICKKSEASLAIELTAHKENKSNTDILETLKGRIRGLKTVDYGL